MQIRSAKELVAYKKGYELAMRVFRLSKAFPAEERFALTSQIRRASRSELTALGAEVGRLLGSMLLHPEKWLQS